MIKTVSAFAFSCALLSPAAALPSQGPGLQPIVERLSQDPVEHFRTAARLFRQGRRDEAVFWFYLGQLRFRAYCKAHPELEPSGAPALLGSLLATLGPPINHYAYGDVPALNRTIDKVLAWDDEHPDPATPKDKFALARANVRQGLLDLRDTNVAQHDQIRADRLKNGLENRE